MWQGIRIHLHRLCAEKLSTNTGKLCKKLKPKLEEKKHLIGNNMFDAHLSYPAHKNLPEAIGLYFLLWPLPQREDGSKAWQTVYIGHGNIKKGVQEAFQNDCVIKHCFPNHLIDVAYILDSSSNAMTLSEAKARHLPTCS